MAVCHISRISTWSDCSSKSKLSMAPRLILFPALRVSSSSAFVNHIFYCLKEFKVIILISCDLIRNNITGGDLGTYLLNLPFGIKILYTMYYTTYSAGDGGHFWYLFHPQLCVVINVAIEYGKIATFDLLLCCGLN